MNDLNSILFEGVLADDPVEGIREKDQAVSVFFRVVAKRSYKENDVTMKESIGVDVHTTEKLAEVCKQYLAAGRGVRIVGRLAEVKKVHCKTGITVDSIVIIAEHVEFKPVK